MSDRPRYELLVTDGRIVFLVALAALLLSKGQALLPGYAFDDYVSMHSHVPAAHFLAQGRFVLALLIEVLKALDVPLVQTSWPASLLLFPVLAASIASGVLLVRGGRGGLYAPCLAAAAMAAHPYLTEYFTFRLTILPMLIGFSGCCAFLYAALRLKSEPDLPVGRRRLLRVIGLLGALVALGSQQNIFVMAVLFVIAALAADVADSGRDPTRALSMNRDPITIVLAASLLYLVAFAASRLVLEGPGDQRATLVSIDAWPARAMAVASLLKKILASPEPLVSWLTKVALALTIAGHFAAAYRSAPRMAAAALLLIPVMLGASLAPVAIGQIWWPAPRAIFPLGVGLGLSLLMLGMASARSPGWLKATGGTAVFFLVLHSAAAMSDQLRLNRWDQQKAALISRDILGLPGVTADTPVMLISADWKYPVGLRTVDLDLNASALAKFWAVQYVLREASGVAWTRISWAASDERCGKARWPAPGSVLQAQGTVVVCL